MFNLYAPQDSPGHYTDGMPEFQLEDVQVRWSQKPDQWPYTGLQVAIIPLDSFWSLVRADRFCAGQRMMLTLNGTSMKDAGVAVAALQGWDKLPVTVKRSGTWIVVFTNCGNSSGAEVSGRISLRQSYGFLPAVEYWTMHVYGFFSVAYAFVAVLWVLILFRYDGFKYSVHHGLFVITMMAWLECICTHVMQRLWNMSGSQNETLATGMLLFNSLKYVFSLRLLLVVTTCGGRFRAEEETSYPCKFYCSAFAFLVQQCMSKLLLQSRHGFALDPKFVLFVLVLGSLICFGIFAWVYGKYAITDDCASTPGKDHEFASLFNATRRLLLLVFGLGSLVVMVQLIDIIWDSTPWELQWIPHDGSPNLAFLIFLVLMMLIWWPDLNIWKLAYTEQVTTHEVEENDWCTRPEKRPEVAETLEEEQQEEQEEILANSPSRRSERVVQPDVVGASSRHADEDEVDLL